MKNFFHIATEQQNLARQWRKREFDFVIIGGGITGAGVARDAASRGLKVALVEARDFAVGTSSRSSKPHSRWHSLSRAKGIWPGI